MAYQYYQNPYQYYPTTYQPMVQPVQQIPQQAQQSYSSNGIIWVDDEREAALFPIAPNNAVALWEKSGKRAFMKKADATGKPTMTVYDLVERQLDTVEKTDGLSDEYAKKSDLAAVAGIVKGLDDIIGSIKSDIETMRGDLYGVAGRKRSVKKQETDDDE